MVFLNFKEAQESILMNRFRQPVWPEPRICKRLSSPEIDSASLVAWRAGALFVVSARQGT
jgi:hypothetical protein